MKYLHIQLSDEYHKIIDEIKFFFDLPNKAAAIMKALDIAAKHIKEEAEQNEQS